MIIITGANGFIGGQMIHHLLEVGVNSPLVGVDPVSPQNRPHLIKPLLDAGKISTFLDRDELWDFLRVPQNRTAIEWIIHMGANSSTTEKNWELLLENNVEYTKKIFIWCAEHGKNLIYASSAATYGGGELGYDDEGLNSEDLVPLNLYGRSKVEVDRWILNQYHATSAASSSSLSWTTSSTSSSPSSSLPQKESLPPHWYGLKFFNVYGPGEDHKGDQASVVLKAFHQILQSGELCLFKSYHPNYHDGEQKRDFVYVKDVTRWIAELMRCRPPSGIYNMGYAQARTWLDLGKATFQALGKPPRIRFIDIPSHIRDHYQYFTEARMEKWRRAGLSLPQWSLEQGVGDYIQYLLSRNSMTL